MNPQYLPQQPQQQYGAPTGPGFGTPPSGFPLVPHGGPRSSPSGTPGGFQLPSGPPASGGMPPFGPPGPQRMGVPPQGPSSPNSNMPSPGGLMPLGPGGPISGPHHPGFSGSNMTNGPGGPSTGTWSEFVILPDTVKILEFRQFMDATKSKYPFWKDSLYLFGTKVMQVLPLFFSPWEFVICHQDNCLGFSKYIL